MLPSLRALSALCLLSLGCQGDKDDSGDGQEIDPDSLVILADDENFSYVGDLVLTSTQTAELSDLHFDWSEVANDLQCHAMDPAADVDNLALMVFPNLSQEEVALELSNDSLQQRDLGAYISFENDDHLTEADLTDLTFFGTDPEIVSEYAEGSGTWMLLLASGTTPGVGTRILHFIEPLASSENTEIDFPDGCGMLDFDADLLSKQTTAISTEGPWVLDWTDLSIDGRGNDFNHSSIDGVMVGRYADLSVEDLQNQFLDIELMADDLWTIELTGGSTADLANLSGDTPFTDFSAEGTWIVALRCSLCSNPAPLFLSVLAPA
jgi:hypothetical protein